MKCWPILALMFVVATCFAQERTVTVRLKDVPVRRSIATVLFGSDLRVEVSPDVKGSVSCEILNLKPLEALGEVLIGVRAIYNHAPDGLLVIRPMVPASSTPAADPAAALRSFQDTSYEGADVRLVVKELLDSAGIPYEMPRDFRGIITLELQNQPLETALRLALLQVDAQYKLRGGKVLIEKRPPPSPPPPMS
ncbi:MAG TPA: hypothetical protein VEX38_05920 [Fimbriimonadaceae bacterium]|nr:hypothetical protein [Fimbriimonadaceae bacterium]